MRFIVGAAVLILMAVLVWNSSTPRAPPNAHRRQRAHHSAWKATRAWALANVQRPKVAPLSSCAHVKSGDAACRACVAAGAGSSCVPSTRSWAGIERNGRPSDPVLPGLRAVRGMDVLRESGVHRLAHWNQSNWPSILASVAPGLVRAVSQTEHARLCTLWKRAHSYFSWPVLLGCPGRTAFEYEPPCANVGAIARIACATIDLASDPLYQGGLFEGRRWFDVQPSVAPPNVRDAMPGATPAVPERQAPQPTRVAPLLAHVPVPALAPAGMHPRSSQRPAIFAHAHTRAVPAPQVCSRRGRRGDAAVMQMGEVGWATSAYSSYVGHFVPEQLPNLLLLHAHLPQATPILVPDVPVARR